MAMAISRTQRLPPTLVSVNKSSSFENIQNTLSICIILHLKLLAETNQVEVDKLISN